MPESRLLERLRTAGVTRSLFYVQPGEPGEVERHLDELAEVAAEWDG
jgi:predicted nucleotidyltransferase